MSFARFSGILQSKKCAFGINFRQNFCRRKGIAKRREGVILYRNSDNSDSTASSRTHVTGQAGHKPDEGIISQQNNTTSHPLTARFDSIEIPICVRQKRTNQPNTKEAVMQAKNQPPKTNRPQECRHADGSSTSANNSRTGGSRPANPRTESSPYLYANGAVRRNAQPSRTEGNAAKATPRAYAKKKNRHPFIAFILSNQKAVITCAVLFLCISIFVPLGVYAAVSDGGSSEPDFRMISTDTADGVVLDAVTAYPGVTDSTSADTTPSDAEVTTDSDAADTDEITEASSAPAEMVETSEEAPETEPYVIETFNVTVQFYDRELLTCTTSSTTLRQLLESAGIWLTELEHPSVGLDDPIENESWITVDKTEYKQVTESEIIPYSTETVNVTSIPRGTYQTATYGQNGSRDTVYTVEYLNGVEVSRTKEYDYVALYPTNEVVYYGVGGNFTAPDGNVYSYSYCMNVRATYYNVHGITASGMPTGTNVVATDPSVFPIGTRMYVMNSTFDMGVKVAADTGGAVNGNLIDIWMDETCPYYEQFAAQGVWDMTVYVLD